ncbi:DNA alkylation repair protein [Paracoccus sp. 1_MG-2023]|uniref:DNA alkylation repair protein n=1 Tax=unclassified Paracoccus (in: a-proteobacteria) TaxID=2688777 RepID=UPI001C090EA3|nr:MULTISPECIES: DNA alkylation repair protein [unclassified Paracoccus (in: a-proteobacteria)]MBU2958685.1 DNA alkylation repair protein [Paracoccus sp. C2R09]MDO6667678.1 DNA alkylation repair protein [Paracoccus sp. 1_MG-2023]
MQEIEQLRALANPERAAKMAARHKRDRETLGIAPAELEPLVAGWRAAMTPDERVALARDLWEADIHEARIAAAKLLLQARMRPDADAWATILEWAPAIDALDIADAVAAAGQRRLASDPERLADLEGFAEAKNPLQRRLLMTITNAWAKMNHPKPADLPIRDRALEWASHLHHDGNGAVRQAVAAWLSDLARHDPERAAAWAPAEKVVDQVAEDDRPDQDPE